MYLASLWYPRRNWPNHSPSIIRRTATHLSFHCPAAKFPSYLVRERLFYFLIVTPPLFILPCCIRIFPYSTSQLPSFPIFLSSSSLLRPFPFAALPDSRPPSRSSFSTELRSALGGLSATFGRFWSGLRKPLRRPRPVVSSILPLAAVFIGFIFTWRVFELPLSPLFCRSLAVVHFVVSNAATYLVSRFLVMDHADSSLSIAAETNSHEQIHQSPLFDL